MVNQIKRVMKELSIKEKAKRYKVLFCDLDGTLIDTISGNTFPKGVWDMKIKFDVFDAIKELKPEVVCIVTNQGGIQKGFVNRGHWLHKADYICHCIKEYTGSLATYEFCSFNEKDNPRRKPNVGMLQRFMDCCKNYVKSDCLMIGDASGKEGQFSDSDKKTAENFGIDYFDIEDFKQFVESNKCSTKL